VLRWVREHGCEWDGHTIDAAQESGCAVIIEYVQANGCPTDYLYDSDSGDDDESGGGESSDGDEGDADDE